ncbi:MAG: hypothetical protein FWD82_07225 [Defluviitaleaceae bacterium]|nr:hypothetical protein [Defluviitaleaceae bacterium]
MIEINEIIIISIDKDEEIWHIEGEIEFESDFTTSFTVDYDEAEDELLHLELELNPGKYDKSLLKSMIIDAASEYED